MLWPNPRKVRVRVWVDCDDSPAKIDAPTRVTVSLDDPGTGTSIGIKTLAAGSLDDAAYVAAGYLARPGPGCRRTGLFSALPRCPWPRGHERRPGVNLTAR